MAQNFVLRVYIDGVADKYEMTISFIKRPQTIFSFQFLNPHGNSIR
jgi:hypothetical protein